MRPQGFEYKQLTWELDKWDRPGKDINTACISEQVTTVIR